MKKILILFALPSLTFSFQFSEDHINYKKWNRAATCCVAKGTKFAVASGGYFSSKCAAEIRQQGGNIIDASVAVAFCLAVERPFSAGLGGGGFLLFHRKDGKQSFVDFRETAPKKAHRDMYLNQEGNVIPGLSLDGGLSVATPGFVAGFFELHKKFGKLGWNKVIEPSIRLAEGGFEAYVSLLEKIENRKTLLLADPELKKIFFKEDGSPIKINDRVHQRTLAKSLELIATKGRRGFYEGELSKTIVETIQARGGIMEASDLAAYHVRWRPPLRSQFQDMTILTAPPPSAGGMIFIQTLNVMGLNSPQWKASPAPFAHAFAEALKYGYANRSQYIGDPEYFKDKTFKTFLTQKYAQKIQIRIHPTVTTPAKDIEPGRTEAKPESGNTTHFSVMDDEGNAVASTLTINYEFGSGISAAGIILNDEMDDFTAKSGEPNAYGLVSGRANEIIPGKRPVSSMMPTILLDRNKKPVLALGAPGGSRIISAVTQTVLEYFFLNSRDLRSSIFAPRIHHQWLPDKLMLETRGFKPETLEELKRYGHQIQNLDWGALVEAVAFEKGQYTAVFDPRDYGGVDAF